MATSNNSNKKKVNLKLIKGATEDNSFLALKVCELTATLIKKRYPSYDAALADLIDAVLIEAKLNDDFAIKETKPFLIDLLADDPFVIETLLPLVEKE
ncbi:MAG: hypothetical protein ACOX2O_00120 [Bdellovibrionota bacterium]|jgi:hypothetical protein